MIAAKIKTLTFNTFERGEPTAHEIRTTTLSGVRWFFANDLCRMLQLNVRRSGLPNTAVACRHLDAADKCVARLQLVPNILTPIALVTDVGLYKLVLRSKRAPSSTLRRWAERNIADVIADALEVEHKPTTLPAALRDRATTLNALADHYERASRTAT